MNSTNSTDKLKNQVMPDHSPESYAALKESIAKYGVLVPVIRNEHGKTIEGHTREAIAADLGIEDIPSVVVPPGLSESEQRGLAYELNMARRHFDQAQKREMVAQSLTDDPQLSDREHARRCASSHPTVAAVRERLQAEGMVERFTTRLGADGVEQPASKPPASKMPPPPTDDRGPQTIVVNRPEPDVEETSVDLDDEDTDKEPAPVPQQPPRPKRKASKDSPTLADLRYELQDRDQQIKALKAELAEANRVIDSLRKELAAKRTPKAPSANGQAAQHDRLLKGVIAKLTKTGPMTNGELVGKFSSQDRPALREVLVKARDDGLIVGSDTTRGSTVWALAAGFGDGTREV
jgi:hypothetical protein